MLLCSWLGYRKPLSHGEVNGSDAYGQSAHQIAHCLIYHQDGHYGFAEPYFIHRTLKDLVLHYHETSLFEHNDELDTTLRVPIGMVDLPTSNTGPVVQVAIITVKHYSYALTLRHHIRFWYLWCCGCPGHRGRQHLATPHTRSP